MLTGGHPNSLGRTLDVVACVLDHPEALETLYRCYHSNDEVVRLRTSNALKRIAKVHPEWVAPFLDRLLTEIANLDQASAQWTLAQLFDLLSDFMNADQKVRATEVMQRNLDQHADWIVLNMTLQTLGKWAQQDPPLKRWLQPRLERHAQDPRKSVSKTAQKVRNTLFNN